MSLHLAPPPAPATPEHFGERRALPNRRCGITETWREKIGGFEHELTVTFGFLEDLIICEGFCSGGKEGAQLRNTIVDGCISFSRGIQFGDTVQGLAEAYGEDRGEGAASGPPSSFLGAIARRGVLLQRELLAQQDSSRGDAETRRTP